MGNSDNAERTQYTAQHIANFFLDAAEAENMPMTQFKLLKLVYIAYGWYLALTGNRLFLESIEAWKHGPVVSSLYYEFKHFRSDPIVGRSEDIDLDTWDTISRRIPSSDHKTLLILRKVWAAYRRFSPRDLREKTHEPGGPWAKVYQTEMDVVPLNDKDILEHYSKRIGQYLDA